MLWVGRQIQAASGTKNYADAVAAVDAGVSE